MKLELDTHSAPNSLIDNHSEYKNSVDSQKEEITNMLRSGIDLAKEGNRPDARQLLLKVTEIDPNNETAWLWLASISEYPEELLVFLQNVLKINPENERALKWAKQTKTLLSKTFVQRGISAVREGQKEFGKQCFLQGIVHDGENEMAWLWLASISERQEEKISHLQKVLQINPDNETALSSLNALRNQSSQILLKKANSAAIAGENETAAELLETIMKDSPNLEEAWVLKAYLAKGFSEKIEYYQKALEINPENDAAKSGLASLQAFAAKSSKEVEETVEKIEKVFEAEEKPQALESENPAAEIFEEVSATLVEPIEAEEKDEYSDILIHDTIADETQNLSEEFSAAISAEESVEIVSLETKETEHNDSPTQELDEEFIKTAEAAFSSFAHPEETVVAENNFEVVEFKQEVFHSNGTPKTVLQNGHAEYREEASVEQTEESKPAFTQTEPVSTPAEDYNPEVDNGFEMVAESEPFTEKPSQTVELSYSNIKVSPENLPFAEESTPVENVVADEKTETSADPFAMTQTMEISREDLERELKNYEHKEDFSDLMEEENLTAEEIHETEPAIAEEKPQFAECPFCQFENETQAIVCDSCQAILSFSDLELILSHQAADQDVLLAAIEKMEVEKTLRNLSVDELIVLGIGYLNIKNIRKGFTYLKEASELNPNDVVLSSKVNFLAIRLSEIEENEAKSKENEPKVCTIMVVDDSPTVRKLISGKLEKCGHTVVAAVDGMDALAKINEIIPDLILLDITMPRLDGYQVCKLIRNNEVTKDIPIVMISGKDGFFDKVRGRMAGSSGYITKPFGPDTLMKTIESYLN